MPCANSSTILRFVISLILSIAYLAISSYQSNSLRRKQPSHISSIQHNEAAPGPFFDTICPDCNKPWQKKILNATLESQYQPTVRALYSDPSTILRPQTRAIRVLTLLPGTFESEIQSELRRVSLDENVFFIALSYCWGEEKSPAPIMVNGRKVAVGTSLELAMRHMRQVDSDFIVWVDALCINQQDDDEKAVQVAMMGDIYTQASLVWIWLGESADDSDVAMDLINSAPNINLEDPNYRLSPVAWSALKRLFLRRWWWRLWVVQEAILSKRAILNCGFKSADIEHLVRLKELQTQYLQDPDPRFEPMRSDLAGPFDLTLADWAHIKAQMAQGGTTLHQMFMNTSQAECSVPSDKIFGILSMCQEIFRGCIQIDYKCCARCLVLKAAKHNFKLAEMYGPLVYVLQTHQVSKNPELPSWAPDFTKDDYEHHLVFPESEGCTKYAAAANNAAWVSLGLPAIPDIGWHIEQTPAAVRLKKALKEHRLSVLSNLTKMYFLMNPSLNPQLSARLDPETYLDDDFGPELENLRELEREAQKGMESAFYRAYPHRELLNSMELVLEDEGEYDTLVLPGLIVDTVSDVLRVPFVDLYTGPDLDEDDRVKLNRRVKIKSTIQEWRHYVHNKLSPVLNPYSTSSSRDEAFWRTLIANRDFNWKGPPTTSSFAGRFEAFLNDDSEANKAYIRPYSHAVIRRLLYRSFVITQMGYFGLGRPTTQMGDLVCILRGGNVPFILRNRTDGYWEFVGEAYVHGIMDGRFVREAEREDVRVFKIR